MIAGLAAFLMSRGGDGAPTGPGDAGSTGGVYAPRETAPGAAEPDSVSGETRTDAETTLALMDGTTVTLPPTGEPVRVTLARETNTIDLQRPGFETTGSMVVLSFSTAADTGEFAPSITVPGREAGEVAYATLQMARMSDILIDGEVVKDKISFLSVSSTAEGNLSAFDFMAPVTSPEGTPAPGEKERVYRVRYSLASFQRDFNWAEAPKLVRMEPDRTIFGRHVADTSGRSDPPPPATNVIVLVHGHAEVEKAGFETLSEAEDPWRAGYKRDVWTLLYQEFREQFPEQLDCTYFYEYIYPTYRPILAEVRTRTASGAILDYPPIGDELARLLAADPMIAAQIAAGKQFNLFVVAHSQGGVMARVGLQALYSGNVLQPEARDTLQKSLRTIVTWGSPHHGSAIWTAGYAFRAAPNHYKLRGGESSDGLINTTFVRRSILPRLAEIAIDAPSVRDLRWDNGTRANPQPLKLDAWFEHAPFVWNFSPEEEYNLRDGTWLYSRNLRSFNERDVIPKEKYVFLYGVVQTPRLAQTQIGAMLNFLIFDGRLIPLDFVQAWMAVTPGSSDGAVPIGSSAPNDLGGAKIMAGDIDHEEYFGSPTSSFLSGDYFAAPEKARETFDLTFSAIDMRAPRCDCATLKVEAPRGDTVTLPAKLNVRGSLAWPAELDESPGGRLTTVEVVLPDDGGNVLGTLSWPADGGNGGRVALSGELDVSKLDEGTHRFFLRALFFDGTVLVSKDEYFSILDPAAATPTVTPRIGGGSTGYWKFKETFSSESAPAIPPDQSGMAIGIGSMAGYFTSVPSTGDPPYTYGFECSWTWSAPNLDRLVPGEKVSATLTIGDTSEGITSPPYGFVSFDQPYLNAAVVGADERRLLNATGVAAGSSAQSGDAVVPTGPGQLALRAFCSNGATGTFERVYEWVSVP